MINVKPDNTHVNSDIQCSLKKDTI